MNTPNANPTAQRELTPRQIVSELDKYVIGQHNAKKSVVILRIKDGKFTYAGSVKPE